MDFSYFVPQKSPRRWAQDPVVNEITTITYGIGGGGWATLNFSHETLGVLSQNAHDFTTANWKPNCFTRPRDRAVIANGWVNVNLLRLPSGAGTRERFEVVHLIQVI